MAIAQRTDIAVFRNDPMHLILAVVGLDLTGAVLKLAVKLYPDALAPTLLLLENQTVQGADGLRLVSVEVDDDGVPTSLVEAVMSKASIQALPASQVFNAPLKLHHDFQWTLQDDGSGFSALEETVLFGEFLVMGSVNG